MEMVEWSRETAPVNGYEFNFEQDLNRTSDLIDVKEIVVYCSLPSKLYTYCVVAISNLVLILVFKMRMNWKQQNHQFTKPLMLKIRVEVVLSSEFHQIANIQGPMVESMVEAISSIETTCLQHLKLRDCSSAISFPGGRLPASLKTLVISNLKNLEFPTQHKHQLLESLFLYNSCDSLKSLPLVTFPNLKSLPIENCEHMESLLVSGAESFKSLCSLRISQCPNFVSFWREGLPAPNLTDFEVLHCDKLKSLPDKMSTLLPKLEYLDISNCPEIESFPEGGVVLCWKNNAAGSTLNFGLKYPTSVTLRDCPGLAMARAFGNFCLKDYGVASVPDIPRSTSIQPHRCTLSKTNPIMAEAVGGAFLSAFLDVVFDKLVTDEVVDFIRGKKLDLNLLENLKTTLRVVGAVLDDAEKKQIKLSSVNQWLIELKDVLYEADDLLDEISTKSATQKKVIKVFSRFTDRKMASKLEKVVGKLDKVLEGMKGLPLQVMAGESNESWNTQPTTSLEDGYGISNFTWDNCFVMHDLVHDLALSLGGEFYFRSEDLRKETKIGIKTRHLSVTKFSDPISKIQVFDKLQFLRTFMAIYFKDSPFNKEKEPGKLIHLRYLNLSFTSKKTLPESLCNLYNLQTLVLSHCEMLTRLPTDMQNLINLCHLHINGTRIEEMPRGMGMLSHLQHLDFFIVGRHKENGIKELGTLSNLHGSLFVRKLENVTRSNEALEARMLDKKHIKHLSLQWSNGNDSQTELDVLCKLKPHQGLESLTIWGYNGTIFPDWVGNFSYHNMTYLSLRDCNNCCVLPSLGQLPCLKYLVISKLNSLKTVDAGFYKNEDCPSVTPFSSLETLEIDNMFCWELWSTPESDTFPLLKSLTIEDCPKLRGDLPNHLPALETLTITNCELLVSSLPTAPTLKRLEICKSNNVSLHVFPLLLESLEVEGSPMVESMIEAITSIEPTCLHHLKLQDYSSAISFPGGHLPASLKALHVSNLKNLEFPTQHKPELMEPLPIYNSCDSLTSLPLVTFPNLKTLRIENCENMESLLGSGSESFKSLNSFRITRCPNIESFPRDGLPAPNLTDFVVKYCNKLKSLPDEMNTLLPKLEFLQVEHCPEIESFPQGGMPPNLRTVWIVNCEKLLSGLAWPSMGMLTNLSFEGPCDGIKSFPKEGLLPPSLVSLGLYHFSNLESLTCKGLLHLTSLQKFEIVDCQKLENMEGERLPDSLIKLSIRRCPLLEKQCHRKHPQIWPKISHIRGINVDEMEDWPVETAPVNGYEFNFELDLNGTCDLIDETLIKLYTYYVVAISNLFLILVFKMRMNWKQQNHQFTKPLMLKIREEVVLSSEFHQVLAQSELKNQISSHQLTLSKTNPVYCNQFISFVLDIMAEAVGGAFLSAFLDVVFDKLSTDEVVDFIRGKKLDLNLLENLKTTLRVVGAVLDDAEKKQIKLSSVNQWLIEVKDALYEADDLLDEISTKSATQKKVSKVLSRFTDRRMASKLEKIVDKLDKVLGGMKGLPLQVMAGETSESWNTQPTTSLEDGYENGIKELGTLSNLHGSLSIRNLENVTRSNEALEARMLDKKHINHLSLEWSNGTDFQTQLDVLCKLKPHPGLESLTIGGYNGTIFPDWVGNFSYHNMTSLSLNGCNNCCVLPSLGQLPSLKKLYISRLKSVKTVDAGFYTNEDCPSSVTPFSSLETLSIADMCCWELWSIPESDAFPLLKSLTIEDCPKLRGDLPNHLPALVTLTITNCELLVSSLPRAPILKRLVICKSNNVSLHVFPLLLEWIDVEGSPMVESMIEAIFSIDPTCLQHLTLRDCSSAISFPGGRLPASLKTLHISNLKNLEFPTHHKHELLESLSLYNSCDSLTSLPLATFPNLKSLQIGNCEHMESLLVSGAESFKSLCSLRIFRCPNFVSFWREGLPAPNLTRIEVGHCDKSKSLPDKMSSLLPKLELLQISDCPEIESFPEGGMPPNLRTVSIGNCEKLMSGLAWPSMGMLIHLYVRGPCDGIKSFPKEGLLPPSLTSLYLYDMSNLEMLDCTGLLHLTSLQELTIRECPLLENMVGERLPVSLIKLTIRGCPLLEKQCRRKHPQIWPKISHIRHIKKAHIYACKADLPGQKEEEAMAQSADGKVFKIVPWHHLEHSTSNSLSIRALSHDLTGSDRSYFQKLFMSLHAMFAFTQRGGFDQIDKDDSNLPLDTAPIKHVTQDNQNMSFPSWEGTFMRCFSEIDEKLAKNIDTDGFHGGSTSVSVLKQGDQVIIGNVGDSRAVLCRRAPDNHLIPVQLTVDLTPDIPREAMRIFAVEEDPTVNRVWMPKGDCPGLAMARAFRNFGLKDYGVASVPDLKNESTKVKSDQLTTQRKLKEMKFY
ncbi:putative disease resistance RPP13-like protein 1 [Glycine soja]